MANTSTPLVVGIGGTTGGMSSTERALRIAMAAAERHGLATATFGGDVLARLPHYNPKRDALTADEARLVAAVRGASALIVASPGYHGSISGLVKNALDLVEETVRDARVYLDHLPVGLIATAYGWQATGSTIAALRSIVHALRAWPTPLAAGINCKLARFDDEGGCTDPDAVRQLEMVGDQVAHFLARPPAIVLPVARS
ncbi:NADPH-dependent FMN reductase [Sphingomonas sp.]|uniref:NADPH-dependent FMN reductase n=1 Tax=Sphingomonas sp. TaxID=28214 RepID=UPI002DD687C6|nr:NAD(P)H-dependent oxidoreductase [Sphingomonas sp.]